MDELEDGTIDVTDRRDLRCAHRGLLYSVGNKEEEMRDIILTVRSGLDWLYHQLGDNCGSRGVAETLLSSRKMDWPRRTRCYACFH